MFVAERYETGEVPDTECFEGGLIDPLGYSHVRFEGRMWLGHRVTAGLFYGWEAIKDKVVLHACDNPACVRIDHLRVGTQSDNQLDSVAKGRHRNTKKTHCPQGHEYSDDNTYCYKLTRQCRTCRRASNRRGRK